MKIGILCAMDTEAKLILSSLTDIIDTKLRGFTYYEGRHMGKDVVLTVCSVGKVNSALSTQIMLDHFGVDFIINSGIAGGLDERLSVLSMVIGDRLTFHDFDHANMRKFFPYQEYFYSDERAVTLANDIAYRNNIHHLTGTIVTGDLFVEDSKKKDQLHNDFGALCVEMEGAAIANTAFINEIPLIVVRAISDLANDGGHMTYEEFKEKASDESAKLVLSLVEEL